MKRRTKDRARPHFELPVEQWLAQRRASVSIVRTIEDIAANALAMAERGAA